MRTERARLIKLSMVSNRQKPGEIIIDVSLVFMGTVDDYNDLVTQWHERERYKKFVFTTDRDMGRHTVEIES